MTIEFNCSHCGKLLRTADDKAGRRAKCPDCGAAFVVPLPEGDEFAGVDEGVDAGRGSDRGEWDDDGGGRPPEFAGGTKTCAMCAEPIDASAVRCPYCGDDVGGARPVRRAGGPQSGLAVASLVLGIVSLPLAFCCGCLSLPTGIAGVVCGTLALGPINRGDASGKGIAITGLACSGVSIVVMLLLVVFQIALIGLGEIDF